MEYKVENKTTVEPNDTESIKINPEKDYVTLVTCTPKFINSHRLLVRGERVQISNNSNNSENKEIVEGKKSQDVVPSAEVYNVKEKNSFKEFFKENKKSTIIMGVILLLISIFILSHKFIKD